MKTFGIVRFGIMSAQYNASPSSIPPNASCLLTLMLTRQLRTTLERDKLHGARDGWFARLGPISAGWRGRCFINRHSSCKQHYSTSVSSCLNNVVTLFIFSSQALVALHAVHLTVDSRGFSTTSCYEGPGNNCCALRHSYR